MTIIKLFLRATMKDILPQDQTLANFEIELEYAFCLVHYLSTKMQIYSESIKKFKIKPNFILKEFYYRIKIET